MTLTPRQCAEFFHLVFLRAIVAHSEGKGLIALKGGCNLRFFFGSVRYSEDIDLDVVVMGKETLRKKVDRLLSAPAVTAPLKAHGVAIVEISAPKQTETTQRWKLGLRRPGDELPIRTRVEFSRRGDIEGAKYEAVDREVLRPYGLAALLAPHYTTAAAVRQKLHALAARAEPQARDVFDLSLLLSRPDTADIALGDAAREWRDAAVSHAIGLSYDDYASTVVAYLEPSHRELYGGRAAWEAMQADVVARIERLR
jgi:predicted nucleotidyltransferase component of viral defense system